VVSSFGTRRVIFGRLEAVAHRVCCVVFGLVLDGVFGFLDRVCVSAIVCCLRFVSCVCLWAFLCGHISTGDFFHG
jgi:hypothetical protein